MKKILSIIISLNLVGASMPAELVGRSCLAPPGTVGLDQSILAKSKLIEEYRRAEILMNQLMNDDFVKQLLQCFKEDPGKIFENQSLIRTVRPYSAWKIMQAMIIGELGFDGEHILVEKTMAHFRKGEIKSIIGSKPRCSIENELRDWERTGFVHDINFNARVGHGLDSNKFKAVSFTYINRDGESTRQKILYSSEGIPPKTAVNKRWYKYVKKHPVHIYFCEDWLESIHGYEIIMPATKSSCYVLLDREIERPELTLVRQFYPFEHLCDESSPCPLYLYKGNGREDENQKNKESDLELGINRKEPHGLRISN